MQMTTHLGGRPQWHDDLAAFVPGAMPKGMAVAGAANGTYSLASCLNEGAHAGAAAASAAGFDAKAASVPAADDEPSAITAFWHVEQAKHKAFVDLQNDVTASDVRLAEHEGYRSVEHLKRYTTLGMATDQGRTSSVNGLAILAELTGKTIPATGITAARPPYTPVSLGVFGGEHRGKHFKPTRLTPSHNWAKERGASFIETGLWLRAQYFPKAGETDWLDVGHSRSQRRAQRRRLLRCLDARQSRSAWHRRRKVSRPRLHQHDEHRPRRPRALRRDAARRRHHDG